MKRVYLIKSSDGPVKIGISNDPHSRLILLQNGHAEKLELICQTELLGIYAARNVEKSAHNMFSDKRLHGEWFDLTTEDIDNIVTRFDMSTPEKSKPEFIPKIRQQELSGCCGGYLDWWRNDPVFTLDIRL